MRYNIKKDIVSYIILFSMIAVLSVIIGLLWAFRDNYPQKNSSQNQNIQVSSAQDIDTSEGKALMTAILAQHSLEGSSNLKSDGNRASEIQYSDTFPEGKQNDVVLFASINSNENYDYADDSNAIEPPTMPLPDESSFPISKPSKKGVKIRPSKSGVPDLCIDTSRMRNMESWKPKIQAYSQRHYRQNTYKLDPEVIVLHYTASSGFPWNLVNSTEFEGEQPGLASHYVVDGKKIWQIIPDNIRSRGAYGINHKALNIEMVATDAKDLARRKETLITCARLVEYLMKKHGIPLNKVYSHQDVSQMNKKKTPEVLDYVNPNPYGKIDPGEENMKYIKGIIRNWE